jgi:hypothetical protein
MMTKKKWTEQRLSALILGLIRVQGKCAVNSAMLDQVFGQRINDPEGLRPRFDPSQAEFVAFCARHDLKMEPTKVPHVTVFTKQSTTVT